MLNAPVIYAQDAYRYLLEARDFASSGATQFETGMPFVLFLGAFLKIFGPAFGEILASRLFMLITSSMLFISLYLFGMRISGRLFGFLATLTAVFEPYCLKYSIVPYTEPFAISMGLLALYFAASNKKLKVYLSPIPFYLAVLTRFELYLPLLVPILIIHFYRKWKISSKQGVTARVIISFVPMIFVYVLPFVGLYQFGLSWGGIGIVERLALFLKPELLKTTLESSFRFYDEQYLNQAIYVLAGLGMILALQNFIGTVKFEKRENNMRVHISKTHARYKRTEDIRDHLLSEDKVITFCLFLFLAIYIVVLTVLGYRYEWAFYVAPSDMANLDILRRAIIIIPRLHDRYLILPRLLISYLLAHTLFVVAKQVYAEILRQR